MGHEESGFPASHTVRVRFFVSLIANVAKAGLGFISGVIIARCLMPAGYGDYNFLFGSFSSMLALVNMGTSSAFYTFLSQKKRGKRFYQYYFIWTAVQFVLGAAMIGFILPDNCLSRIWLTNSKGMILLAFLASFIMNQLWITITQIGESVRSTVIVQKFNIVTTALYVVIISILAIFRQITIPNIFITIFGIYSLSSVLLILKLKRGLVDGERDERLSEVAGEFYRFCAPLVLYNVVGFFYSFADLWLLQRFGGSVQQGLFSVGMRFSAICLIAATSINQIFWKEIADASRSGDKERLYMLYRKITRGLLFLVAAVACFLTPFSSEILALVLGKQYEAGALCLAIIFFYPIYQSLGQINNAYFYATSQTKLSSLIGMVIMVISVPLTYLLLASPSMPIPGLGLGSVGLAAKMVVLQIILVNAATFFVYKIMGRRIEILYQFKTIGLLLLLSFSIKGMLIVFSSIAKLQLDPFISIACSVPVYAVMVAIAVWLSPDLAGMKRDELVRSFGAASGFIKGKFSV